MKMAWLKLPKVLQVSTKSYESPRLNVKSETNFSVSDLAPEAAEIYQLPRETANPRTESNAGRRLRIGKWWRPFLLTSVCLGLLGWAGYATKNWLDSESLIRDLEVSISRLERDLSALRGKNEYLRQKNSRLESTLEQKSKESRVFRLQSRSLQRELAYAGQKINALKTKIRELSLLRRELLLKPSLKGIIARVNPVYEYAMINLGTEHGVQEGKELFVLQKGVIKGTLKVEESFENFSLCSMRPSNLADPFQSGDLVLA